MADSKLTQSHSNLETKGILFPILVTIAILVGGLVEVLPPFFMAKTVEKIDAVKPYSALELTGRDIYVREGCYNCHSQLIRPLKWETDRFDPTKAYGDAPYTKGGEYAYDHPFQWGSKRTGPDLAHESQIRPNEDWHKVHLINPQETSPGSPMPAYPWLFESPADADMIQAKMKSLALIGVPYTEQEIEAAPAAVQGKTEGDALIAYLMKLGRDTAQK